MNNRALAEAIYKALLEDEGSRWPVALFDQQVAVIARVLAAHEAEPQRCSSPEKHRWKLRDDGYSFVCVLCDQQEFDLLSKSSESLRARLAQCEAQLLEERKNK